MAFVICATCGDVLRLCKTLISGIKNRTNQNTIKIRSRFYSSFFQAIVHDDGCKGIYDDLSPDSYTFAECSIFLGNVRLCLDPASDDIQLGHCGFGTALWIYQLSH